MKIRQLAVDTKRTIIYKKRFWAGLWLAQFCLFFLLSKTEKAVVFFEKLFSVTQNIRVKIIKHIPFSLGDVFYTILCVSLVYALFLLFRKEKRSKCLMVLLVGFNILYFIYQLFWGMLYFQKPLLSRDKIRTIDTETLKPLADYYLQQCVILRKENPQRIFKIGSMEKLEQEIKVQQQNIARVYGKGSNIDTSLKQSIYRQGMSYTGILGYYNPFTSESQYNPKLPDTYTPFTLAHETAHQIGFAREEEANFIAFIIGENSSSYELKYSAYWYALKTILFNISRKDLQYSKNFLKNLPEDLLNDYKAEIKFYKEHEGQTQDFFSFTNNLFLKSNRQDGSITYNYFIYLLLDHHKEKGLHQ
nr:DUF3810 domain-containing protein [Elizabethkingia meningoseptica]